MEWNGCGMNDCMNVDPNTSSISKTQFKYSKGWILTSTGGEIHIAIIT